MPDMIDHAFPRLLHAAARVVVSDQRPEEIVYSCDRSILTALNKIIDAVNRELIPTFPKESITTYFSSDSVDVATAEERALWPTDFLHLLTPAEMSPHELALTPSALIMLLRNMDVDAGLCNDVRAIEIQCLP